MDYSSFWGFPTLTCFLFCSEPVIFRNLYHSIFLASVGTFSGSFSFHFYFSVPYFGLACEGHGNSFLCLEE